MASRGPSARRDGAGNEQGRGRDGYSDTIGTGGPAVVELIACSLAPALIGREGVMVEKVWRGLLFLTDATSVGAITSLAPAAIDTA